MANQQLTLPITGMTCANCAVTIERGLKKLPSAANVAVNLASERATLEFDPAVVALPDVIARIEKSGYGVAVGGEIVLCVVLSSCVLGVVTFNIDNDYNAACTAVRVLRTLDRPGS